LRVVWRWKSANFGPEPETYYRATPLFARGRLFTVAGERRAVAAIHPGSGETLWTWRLDEGPRWEFAPRRFSGRGLAYWTDGRDERVIVVTPGFHLVALDAGTGKPAAGFGEQGVVDLHRGLGYELVALDSVEDRRATNPGPNHPWWGIDPLEGKVGSSSPPIVVGDVIVVGSSAIQGYYPRRLKNVPGAIRGFDVRTGKQLWVFNVIPKAGELGHDSWLNESWKVAGKVDAWAPYSADTELGIVYLPVGHAHNDHFGGHRPGANLFSQSVLALDARTGRRVWHYQLVHHDLWNSDTPTAPNVVDVAVGGRPVKMVVQTTKQAWAYVFDRTNGRPVWPIEERPVARSDVPGEWTSPTQPFPTRPRAYESQGVSADDLIDFTPALRQEALTLIKDYRIGPIFTPPSILTASDGTKGILQKPGANGGTNIQGGAAVDPETGILYVASIAGHSRIALEHNPARSEMDYVSMGPSGLRGPQGLPLFRPPYGRITAIDLKTGEHRWWIPNGDTPRALKTHEALRGLTIAPTGKNSHANILVTKTLLFYGEGTNGDPLFHIADKATGRDIRSVRLPASTNAAPMTFMYNGRQYIVVAVADADVPGELVALALSAEPRSSGNQSDR
jgi:quinoprotein glucose dehydrogenase